jgi:hypothetical protein
MPRIFQSCLHPRQRVRVQRCRCCHFMNDTAFTELSIDAGDGGIDIVGNGHAVASLANRRSGIAHPGSGRQLCHARRCQSVPAVRPIFIALPRTIRSVYDFHIPELSHLSKTAASYPGPCVKPNPPKTLPSLRSF